MNLIRLDILIPINNGLVVAEESDTPGGLPKKFGSASRIPPFHLASVNNIQISIGPSKFKDPTIFGLNPNCGLLQLALRVTEVTFDNALRTSRETIELIIDHLSFQLQEPLYPMSLDLVDVTKPVSIGDERQCRSVTDPASFLLPKYFTSQTDFSIQSSARFLPTLDGLKRIESRADQVSLWWYIKSLSTPFLIDRLSFLFIIIDNISKPHKKGPYKTNCNHEISNCPVCEASLERPLIGDSVKEYMTNHGFSASEARELWNLRQIVHGRDLFDYKEMQKASTLINRLKMIVFNELKTRLGINLESLPKVDKVDGPVVSQNVSLLGSRTIDSADKEIEIAFDNASM